MDNLCHICERVAFGKIVRLGFNHWRHDYCEIGSDDWKLWKDKQSKADRVKLNELHSHYEVHND